MDDDFNTPWRWACCSKRCGPPTAFWRNPRRSVPLAVALLAHARALFTETGGVLGLFGSQPAQWLEGIKAAKAGQIGYNPRGDRAADRRNVAEARTAKNFKRGDEIRDHAAGTGASSCWIRPRERPGTSSNHRN